MQAHLLHLWYKVARVYETSVAEYNDSSGHGRLRKYTFIHTMGFSIFHKMKEMVFFFHQTQISQRTHIFILSLFPKHLIKIIHINWYFKTFIDLFCITRSLNSKFSRCLYKKKKEYICMVRLESVRIHLCNIKQLH